MTRPERDRGRAEDWLPPPGWAGGEGGTVPPAADAWPRAPNQHSPSADVLDATQAWDTLGEPDHAWDLMGELGQPGGAGSHQTGSYRAGPAGSALTGGTPPAAREPEGRHVRPPAPPPPWQAPAPSRPQQPGAPASASRRPPWEATPPGVQPPPWPPPAFPPQPGEPPAAQAWSRSRGSEAREPPADPRRWQQSPGRQPAPWEQPAARPEPAADPWATGAGSPAAPASPPGWPLPAAPASPAGPPADAWSRRQPAGPPPPAPPAPSPLPPAPDGAAPLPGREASGSWPVVNGGPRAPLPGREASGSWPAVNGGPRAMLPSPEATGSWPGVNGGPRAMLPPHDVPAPRPARDLSGVRPAPRWNPAGQPGTDVAPRRRGAAAPVRPSRAERLRAQQGQARVRGKRARRAWPRRLVLVGVILAAMAVCWFWIFPWLESVLPTDF